MNKLHFLKLSKREKFVLAVFFLSCGLFVFEYFGIKGMPISVILAIFTDLFLYLILRNDLKGTFFYPLFILPFLYTISFSLFYLLFPARFISRFVITILYAFGLYSLFLTQNIFAVSSIRTINLLRSARIVSFVLSLVILFFLIHVVFSMYFPAIIMSSLIFLIIFVLGFQSFYFHSLEKEKIPQILLYSLFNSLAVSQIAFVLTIWPVNATIYSITLTGIYYAFSGLSQNWFEERLFKGILWEYIWVGFLSILILFLFSNWGI